MGDEIKKVLAALAHSENAMSFPEFVQTTGLSNTAVTQCLDLLVAFRIFQYDNSYHNHEIGEIVYMFADNDNAQKVYESLIADKE